MALDLRRERSPGGTDRPGPRSGAGPGLRPGLGDEPARPERPAAPATVTAVVVARRSEHLAAVLHGVADQSRRPDRVIGIAVGEDPRTTALLRTATTSVLALSPAATVGDAVTAALAVADADTLDPAPDPRPPHPPHPPHPQDPQDPQPPGPPPAATEPQDGAGAAREWVWVLDDCSFPTPKALEELLTAVGRAPQVAVAGCKHRAGDSGLELVEAGATMSRWGRRLTGVEPGEPDQGQLDGREDVLAVSPVGMLVARDLWDALGGTDPALPDSGADLDLGRRARLAGHRVVVVPGAILTRPVSSAPEPQAPAGTRRSAAYLRLAAAPWWALPGVAVSVLLGGVVRSMLGVAAKEPGRGAAALLGALGVLSRPGDLLRSRRRAARARTQPRSSLRPLHAGSAEVVRWHRTRWADRRPAGDPLLQAATLLDPPVPAGSARRTGRAARWPAVALVTVLTGASLAALSGVVGGGPVTAADLPPVPGSASELWDAARSGWVPAGAGHPGTAAPLLTVLAALAALAGAVGGSPSAAVAALLLAAVPAAGVAAWWAAGALTRRPGWRLVAALAWAASPSLLLAVDAGRLGALLAHVLLPVVVRCAAAAALTPHRRSGWSWAGCAALALVPVAAGSPLLLVPLAVLALVVAAVSRRPSLPAAVLPALALVGPALGPSLAALGDAEAAGADPVPSWHLALGWPQAPQTWPAVPALPGIGELGAAPLLAAAAVPVLLALVALPVAVAGGRRAAGVRWGLALAVTGLLGAVVAARLAPASGQTAGGGQVAATSLVVLGLLVCGLAATRGGTETARRLVGARGTPGRVPAAALSAGVALLAVVPLAGVLGWSAAHAVGDAVEGPRRGVDAALPAAVVDTATSPDQSRVLALRARPDGSVGVSLLRGDGPGLESTGGTAPPPDAADAALDRATVDLLSGVGDPRPGLAPFGVGAVVVLPERPAVGTAGGTGALVDALDATAALTPSGRVEGLRAWRVEAASGPSSTSPDRPAALRLLGPDGAATALPSSPSGAATRLAAGPEGRTLTLAERRDPGWTATLDGRELRARTVDGWAQGWDVPAGGGRLDLRHESAAAPWWGPLQAVLLGLAALVAVPVLRAPRASGGSVPGGTT